jgi:hypothetical protein
VRIGQNEQPDAAARFSGELKPARGDEVRRRSVDNQSSARNAGRA